MRVNLKLFRDYAAEGWRSEVTGGNHVRLTHPRVKGFILAALTASDVRAKKNIRAMLKRALRDGVVPGYQDRNHV